MLKIYLLRHGQTLFNIEEIVQGWNDSPLSELGQYQARCTGYGLKDVFFTQAYCGDTGRQIETAQAFLSMNSHETSILTDFHFREMCYGKYQDGPYFAMLNQLYEKVNAVYDGYDGLYRFYNDIEIATMLKETDETGAFEGPLKLFNRFKEGLDQICEIHQEGNILISTSSMAICSVIHYLFPEVIQKHLVENASITVLSYHDHHFDLLEYNNIEYRKKGEEFFNLI